MLNAAELVANNTTKLPTFEQGRAGFAGIPEPLPRLLGGSGAAPTGTVMEAMAPSVPLTPGTPTMFTGIVEELGHLQQRDGGRLRFGASTVLGGVALGDSISVNGCCLTVVAFGDVWWEADAVDETFARTSLGDLSVGDPVNLERPVRPQDRLGGHIVQGHVDGVGVVVGPAPDLVVEVPDGLTRYVVEKGSITIDGVSLTVVSVTDDELSVAVIPHTSEVTTLGSRRIGDKVNLEVDVVAKYVERLAAPAIAAAGVSRGGR